MSASAEFQQLAFQFVDPIQHDYEVIRPIVLFSATVTTRSQEVDLPRTTVGEKAGRFVKAGMLGLVDQRTTASSNHLHEYPAPVAAHILYLKQIYPPIHYREIVRIVKRKFGYHTNHHTVKRFLERHPIPVQLAFDFPTFHDFDDAYQARWTVVRMYYEGWNKQSIAGCLQLSRTHVYQILAAFEADGFAGLEDQRTRPPDHPANQLTLPLLHEVRELQAAYPHVGRFRLKGLLEATHGHAPSERTVGRAMALNRQYHEVPSPWHNEGVVAEAGPPTHLLYRPHFRHHLWFIDIRYLVRLESGWVYSVCLLEGYSRKILAGMATPYQDLVAVLQLIRAALAEYGCPAAVVSDNGSVFKATAYEHILHTLHIQPLRIEQGRPWQNLIEANFGIQRRLADHHFEQATTLEEVQDYHAEFIDTFNRTPHWAHRERADGRTTPEQVLEWVRGRPVDLAQLDQLFRHLQFARTVNRHGFVSVQRFYIYAERGLARQRVSIWIYEGRLHIEYQHHLLAEYHYQYDRRSQRLQEVFDPVLHATEFASPQLEFWELDDAQWLKVRPRPYHRTAKRAWPTVEQLPLFRLAALLLLLAHRLLG